MKALLAAAVLATATIPALPAQASDVYPMVFPVQGPNHYTDDFGAPRSGHTHQGIDIMAAKMTPVVAVADGTVGWVHDVVGGNCCAMALLHDDGWQSWYIHLNNDTPGTDDGQGWGFAPGITTGVHVTAGQLIAYVGDSGNAENVAPHLHFELHDPSGTPIDPYQSLLNATRPRLPRIAGADRYATAAAVSESAFPDGAGRAFVAVGTGFADALAGAALAGMDDAPILLVAPGSLPSVDVSELTRLHPSEVDALGGTGVVPDTVLAAAGEAAGAPTERLAGSDRYETAAVIARHGFTVQGADGVDTVFIVNGNAFPDALAGAPVAAELGGPILMVTAGSIPAATASALTDLKPAHIVILGGTGVVSDAVAAALAPFASSGDVTRVAGANRYETAAAIALQYFPDGAPTVYLATGEDFADALAAAPVAGAQGAPILLVPSGSVPSTVIDALVALKPTKVVVLGGEGAVGSGVEFATCAALPDVCSS